MSSTAVAGPGGRAWSPARLAQAAVLGTWAALFWALLLTGRSSLYLSPRTGWVIPVGAAICSAAALARLTTARTAGRERLSAREAWGLAAVALPAVLVLSLPPQTLSSYAVSRRASFVRAGFSASAQEISSGALTLLDVAAAQTSEAGERALATRAGETVSFVGFVDRRPGTPADEFLLTRFIVSCCVADATIAQVRVVDVPPGRFAADDWVRVTGRLYPLGREVIVDASRVEPVPRPDRPYLTP
ncbi:MAG TPA: TIGR03943 family protein [Actinomycetota bacterium]|nr:TIGR03943 family protein [Actinomycetota bacterium]